MNEMAPKKVHLLATGDVVRLRGGGPMLTVIKGFYKPQGSNDFFHGGVDVTWIDEAGNPHSNYYPSEALILESKA
jgi:uncharacterized protein YodC (DUF2158 family)